MILSIAMSEALGFLGKIVPVIVDRPMNSKHSDFELVYSVNYGFSSRHSFSS